jgi:SAM-dependent methyltransferase
MTSPIADQTLAGRTCELCDGGDFELLSDRDRHGKPLATEICRGCGLISHRTIPTEAELIAYYASDYRQQYHREETPRPTRVVRDWRRGKRLFDELHPLLKPNARVFEIGAGVGCNLKHFDLAGYDATGIEPGAGFQKYSRETLRAKIAVARLEEVPAEPAYDLVLLVHVIEHLRSPTAALRHIRSLLRPGGRLYMECPNVAAPHAPLAKLFHFAHIYNFTPATLALLSRRCGLQVERVISREDDRYLKFVFRRAEPQQVVIPPDLFQDTREAVTRFNSFTFHMRPKYLAYRGRSLVDYLSAKYFGGSEYQQILAACRQGASATPARRAA